MDVRADREQETFGHALARLIEARRGAGAAFTGALRELGTVDAALYEAVAQTPTPLLDGPVGRLSRAANQSRLWLGIAAALAALGGPRGRRAAADGAISIGVTSAAVNLGLKSLAGRPRPDRGTRGPFQRRRVIMPDSTSFPSGHAASAFAFAYAVGRHLPPLAVPVRLMAGAVAYSRVHSGVHYPGDVAVGAIIGAGTAAMTGAVLDRAAASRRRHRDHTPGSAAIRPAAAAAARLS
ncbi:MAG TPA: phosphatase PAP2 family protein [Streptosporangiaceae bacterium]